MNTQENNPNTGVSTPLSPRRGAGGEAVGCEAVDHLLGLRSRYQHIGAHLYPASAEVGVSDDMLNGAVLLEVLQRPMEPQQVALVDGLLLAGQQPHLVPSQEGLEKHVEKHPHLAAVHAIQLLMEEADDVAHAITAEAKVSSIHAHSAH